MITGLPENEDIPLNNVLAQRYSLETLFRDRSLLETHDPVV